MISHDRRAGVALAALLCLLACASAAPLRAASLQPRDECAADKSFAAYRERLRTAVARRDADALLALVAPDIMIDLGGGSGRAAFVDFWRLREGRRSPIWRELDMLLRLGCARGDGIMSMPYFFQHLPADADPVQQLAVIGPDVPLQAEPRSGSRILARLSWELVDKAGPADMDAAWIKIQAHGQTGYVAQGMVRELLAYRAVFARAGGGWSMSALIAGD